MRSHEKLPGFGDGLLAERHTGFAMDDCCDLKPKQIDVKLERRGEEGASCLSDARLVRSLVLDSLLLEDERPRRAVRSGSSDGRIVGLGDRVGCLRSAAALEEKRMKTPMGLISVLVPALLILSFGVFGTSQAGEQSAGGEGSYAAPGAASSAFPAKRSVGIGIQAAPFPIFGPAVTVNPTQVLGLQLFGRVGLVDVDFGAIRVLVRPKVEPNYNVYLSGLFGTFKDQDVSRTILGPEESDQGIGFGFGGGVEYFFSGLPEVGWNFEVDYIHIGFEDVWWDYDYETPQMVMLGLGITYYF
ncbi:MAG: hypothetical protein FJY73_13565 [Candidatus Eisenbacteria bacterium]|nr:hypothetical protein [Candidatus Eisenbacteria bacterium]